MAQGTRKLNSVTQADTDAIVSSYFSGSARRQTRSARPRQCLHLKVTVGFGVIHERSAPEQAKLQSIGRVGGVGGVGTPSTQLSWSGLPDLSQMKRQPREV